MFPENVADPEYPTDAGSAGMRKDGRNLVSEWMNGKKVNCIQNASFLQFEASRSKSYLQGSNTLHLLLQGAAAMKVVKILNYRLAYSLRGC